MQRKKSRESIVSEINYYACKQANIIFRLTKSYLKELKGAKSRLCSIEKAALAEESILLNCRYVIGRNFEQGEEIVTLGEQFEITVDRYTGMSIARAYRKRFGETKEFGLIE
jgi:hypothetical protein